jgi:hypothetical protein
LNQEEIAKWSNCGHEECARKNREHYQVAKMLGIRFMGDEGYVTDDPEAAVTMIRYLSKGQEGLAVDLVSQLEELANRGQAATDQMERVRYFEGELATTIKGGRVQARKIGRRSFWKAVKQWLTRPHTN